MGAYDGEKFAGDDDDYGKEWEVPHGDVTDT